MRRAVRGCSALVQVHCGVVVVVVVVVGEGEGRVVEIRWRVVESRVIWWHGPSPFDPLTAAAARVRRERISRQNVQPRPDPSGPGLPP